MKLQYPFTFEEWLNHKSTIPKIKWIKKVVADMKQYKIQF